MVSVTESTGWSRQCPTTSKYRALRCQLVPVTPDNMPRDFDAVISFMNFMNIEQIDRLVNWSYLAALSQSVTRAHCAKWLNGSTSRLEWRVLRTQETLYLMGFSSSHGKGGTHWAPLLVPECQLYCEQVFSAAYVCCLSTESHKLLIRNWCNLVGIWVDLDVFVFFKAAVRLKFLIAIDRALSGLPSNLLNSLQPRHGQSLVFVGLFTLQTLLPVFIGYELPSEWSSNWRLLSTELFMALQNLQWSYGQHYYSTITTSVLKKTENLLISAILPGHYTVVSDCFCHGGPSSYFLH